MTASFTGAWPSTLLALAAAGTLVFGSALPFLKWSFFERRLSLLIGFSAGLMLATALHELLPEAIQTHAQSAVWGATFGFLTLYAAERLTHFHACRHRQCDVADDSFDLAHLEAHAEVHVGGTHSHEHHDHAPHSHSHGHTHGHADTMALVGMAIHNFADGLTTAAAFAVSGPVGLVVVLAIVLHQTAAGLSLGAIMLRMGRNRKRILLSTSLIASFIVWGALFYHFLPLGAQVQGFVLGLAGGSFLYVAACDLLPEAHAEDEGWNVMAMTLAGFVFALGIKALFE